MTKQRVALFVPSLRGGGAERVMVTLANNFAARGLNIDLVLVKAEGPYLSEVNPKVRILDLGASRVASSLLPLMQYLQREQPDAMLSALKHANVIAIIAKKLSRAATRLVVSEHSTLSATAMSSAKGRAKLMPWLMRISYPAANAVVAVSSGSADALAENIGLKRESISVVYNPFDCAYIRKLSLTSIDHPWFAAGQPPVILAVGRLTSAKDYPTLIYAFAKLRKQRAARLLILGEGELRSELESQISHTGLSEDIALPGFVENPFSYMRRAAVFVMSSAWEGLPSVLIQAMACGTPVVSTDCASGPSEILENGKWGRLVPVGDVDTLARAMAETLDETIHPDITTRAADFTVERSVAGYLNVAGIV
jgi:glycosyltransferase involved in cell wall biosynthesis